MSNRLGKILVADDEVELKNILVEALTSQGYEAAGYTSGEDALAVLREQPFDVLLTDLMMPGMDGLTLLKEALQIDPNLVCIMMTGQGTIQTAVDAMRVGAFDYVLKPFRLQTMLPVLTRAMNTRHLLLENVQLREAIAIHELSETIAFTLDTRTVLSKLADAALLQSEADEVSVLLPTEAGDELYVAAVRGEKRERLLGERVPIGDGIASWVAREREPVILNGQVRDDRFIALWPRAEINSSISVPMLVAQKLVGVLNLNVINRPRPFTLGQMKALTILAGTAAAALESASLYTQVEQAERNYRSIFENSVEGIFQATPEGKYLTANPAMARILGYDSPQDLIESITNIHEQVFVHPEACTEALTLVETKEGVKGFQIEAYRKDGKKIWLSMNIRAVRAAAGSPVYCEGTIEDITERKRAVEALRESEERYRDLVENAEDIIYSHDLEGNYTAANRAREDITGYTLEESLKLSFEQTIAPEYQNTAREMIARKLAGEHTPAYELDFLTKDGGRVPVEVNTRLVFSDGIPIGVTGVARDITERKRSEGDLAMFRRLVDQSNDGIYVAELDTGCLRDVNETGCRQLGYTRDELLNLRVADLSEQMAPPAAWENFRATLESAGSLIMEFRAKRKDGSTFPIEASLRYARINDRRYALAVIRDITERKTVQAELTRLATAVEQTGDSIVITDTNGNIEYVNPAFERITGYTKEEALGKNPRILKSGKTEPSVFRDLWETIARGGVWSGQLINRKKDGTLFNERATISAVLDDSGKIAHYIAVKQDTTRETQLEDRLRQSQKMEAIGQLAGGVAHDFNNLLTAINGYSSLALKRTTEGEVLNSYVREIKKAGDRAANLTRQLLAFGRKQMLQPIVLNLNNVVGDMNKMLCRLIGEDINLTARLDPELKQIKADPGQIEQVLVNLVVNARDAMPQGGNLTIETANVEIDGEFASRHGGAQPGNYVLLAISDTGTGINDANKARIFEPFFTTKEKGKGTGLGLSTVYGIVKQSGGYISVDSEPGKGATFQIYLRQVESAPRQVDTKVPELTSPPGSETIMLVEDDDVVRGLAQTILEHAGYQVLEARGGEDALRVSNQHSEPIHLLLTDVVMPGFSGKEIADRLALLRPTMRVLFMSGYTDDAIVHHGIIDSGVQFIQKPFSPVALATKVREVLDSNTT